MSQKIAGVKGMNDLLPGQIELWQRMEGKAREIFQRFGFGEIRTPVLEETRLFVRGVGEQTDIVGKEMYTFEDKAGRSLSLRPEGTAPAARAYIEHAMYNQDPFARWFYMGPMFRYERMKTGRYRQFWQIGAEAYGVREPTQDVEMMAMVVQLLQELGLRGIRLTINSLGDETCRPAYSTQLVNHFHARQAELCGDCQRRLEHNPLRILDCKNESCRRVAAEAPNILEFLCQPCAEHFAEVKRRLALLGLEFDVDARMVRGLDYYTRTAFEFIAQSAALGTASTVGGGGRYDQLVKGLGGPEVPAVGFALGVDRLALLLSEVAPPPIPRPQLFVAAIDARAQDEALRLAIALRRQGFWVQLDPRAGSLKSQMKQAHASGAVFTLVLGENELSSQMGELKQMAGGEPKKVALGVEALAEALRSSG